MDCNKSHCSYVYEIMSVTRKDPEKSCNFFFGFEIRTYPQIFGNVIFVITLFYNISRKHNRLKEKGLAPAMALFLPAVYPIFLSLIFTSFFFFLHDFSLLDMCKVRRTPKHAVYNE